MPYGEILRATYRQPPEDHGNDYEARFMDDGSHHSTSRP